MAGFWLVVGIACFLCFAVLDAPSGSPPTTFLTVGCLFLGLANGGYAAVWWPLPPRVISVLGGFPVGWIVFALGLWWLYGSPVSAPWGLGAWAGYLICSVSKSGDRYWNYPRTSFGWALRSFVRVSSTALLLLTPVFGDALLREISLDLTDTIGDYRQADVEDVVRFHSGLCRNGECLTREDWACGFSNGDDEAFDRCFNAVVARADPSVRLEAARKYCGNRTMEFTGSLYSNPERCQSAGGRWGVKTTPPSVGF